MRLVHTADWHLGHRLGVHDRSTEHAAFLSWLLDVVEEERAHALLVCGDVFDRGNPPPEALTRFFSFLAAARARMPRLQIVVIGGNHDAPSRMDAPVPVLDALGVHVRGALPRTAAGGIDYARVCVPLVGDGNDVEAIACLLPFVRATDTHGFADAAELSAAVLERAFERRPHGAAVVALAHAELEGAAFTPDSERRVVGGALCADTLSRATYAALGHLHFAQQAGSNAHVRYSGSPIPLSMAERGYHHAVTVVELEGAAFVSARQREVPRTVDLVRIGDDDASMDAVLSALADLKVDDREECLRPFLDVRVRVEGPEPDLRGRVERALGDKPARLVRVQAARARADVDVVAPAALIDATPESVLERLFLERHQAPLPEHLRRALAALLEDVERERADDAEAA